MAMESRIPASPKGITGAMVSRRHALVLMMGACRGLSAVPAADGGAALRFGISESVIGEVNLNDARVAMQMWVSRVTREVNLTLDPRLFLPSPEILERARAGRLDALALNVVEYRQIAEFLDPSQIVTAPDATGLEQYLILVKQSSGIRHLGELKGRRLCMLRTPRACVAPTWLSTLLEEGHHGPAEQFFSSVVTDAKFAKVVLPVFFGQADACVTTRRGFETMAELNPQVARELTAIASSPPMFVSFYVFRKNYQSANREKLIQAFTRLRSGPAGAQLATLFQFDELIVRDSGCLANAVGILEAAERARGRRDAGGRKA
jgi:phosphonate transport system substrate-binding protein